MVRWSESVRASGRVPRGEYLGVESAGENGVALIGDAGCLIGSVVGLVASSLTLLDVEHWQPALCASKDWEGRTRSVRRGGMTNYYSSPAAES